MVVGPFVIERLNRLQIGQTIRAEGPQSHLEKAGTPPWAARYFVHRAGLYASLGRPEQSLRVGCLIDHYRFRGHWLGR